MLKTWHLQGAHSTHDASERGNCTPGTLEILLSNRGAFVTGTVLDAQGNRADDVVVLVLSADRERRRTPGGVAVRLLVPPKGPYTAGPLRAGEYLVIAVHGEDSDVYAAEPEMLEALAGTPERVVLAEGDRRPLDLRLAAPR
jgi:hypothetical protein